MLVVLYLLQVVNAEMLRRAIGADDVRHLNHTAVTQFVEVLTERLHPLAMTLFGVWLVIMAVRIFTLSAFRVGRSIPLVCGSPCVWYWSSSLSTY